MQLVFEEFGLVLARFRDKGCFLWQVMLCALLWNLWVERNSRVFRGVENSSSGLFPVLNLMLCRGLLVESPSCGSSSLFTGVFFQTLFYENFFIHEYIYLSISILYIKETRMRESLHPCFACTILHNSYYVLRHNDLSRGGYM